jgi:hypothetical protein
MDYIIALIVLVIVVPLIFLFMGRASRGAGGMARKPHSGGVTPSKPSSDEPSAGGGAINQPPTGQGDRIPPG